MSRTPSGIAALYLDFDSFFASAEQHLRPELRGRPVGVTPMPGEYTCLIAASREAKVFGFKVGTPVREARKLCPDIAIVPARPDAYVRLHHAILAVIDTVVPIGAVRSIDELVCHLMLNEQARGRALALDIKAALAREIGPVLTCSIGLGPNELIAKIAAEMNKPDGLVVIRKQELPEALYGLKLQDIPGIAKGNAARLARAGITDTRGLLALAPKQMRALWGGVEGERMHAALHGDTVERPETTRGMFGHSRILPRHWCMPGRLSACTRLLLVKAARRMRREGFAARSLSFSIRLRDGNSWYEGERFDAARDDQFLLGVLQRLLHQAYTDGVMDEAKSVAVTLTDIVPTDERAPDLFTTPDMIVARDRREKLSDVTDRLAARFGDSAAMLGVQRQPPGGYAGAKIAFGRIPDLADFDRS
ncbi:MAG: Y-family DNA polymerase [Beijerinckiaceae bacterium]